MAYNIIQFINLKDFDPCLGINPDAFQVKQTVTYANHKISNVNLSMMDGRLFYSIAYRPNINDTIRMTINDTTMQYNLPDQFSLFSFDVRIITLDRQRIDYYFYYDQKNNISIQNMTPSSKFSITDPEKLSLYILLSARQQIANLFKKVGVKVDYTNIIDNLPQQYINQSVNVQAKLRIKYKKTDHSINIFINNNYYSSGSMNQGYKKSDLTFQIRQMDTSLSINNFLTNLYGQNVSY